MDRERLTAVFRDLEREGVLNPSQSEVVLGRLQPFVTKKTDGMGRFIAIVAMLGAFLVGAGILLFFASNWSAMPKAFKLALIFGCLLGAHHFGFRLAEGNAPSPRIGRALTALGVLLFGAAVGLIAQIYHLTSHYPWAVLLWWVTSIPFVLLTRSRAILSIVVVLFGSWLAAHTWVWLDDRNYTFDREWLAAYSTLGLGVAAAFKGAIVLLRRTNVADIANDLRLYSAPCGLAGVYALSFRDVFDDRSAPAVPWDVFLPAACVGGAGLVMLLIAYARNRARADKSDFADTLDGFGLVAAIGVFALVLRFLPAASVVVGNLMLFGGLLVMIARGVQLHVPAYVNYGILGFLIAVITRYFEYLYAFMDPFWSFIGAGVLLLGFGHALERRRRVLIQKVAEGRAS